MTSSSFKTSVTLTGREFLHFWNDVDIFGVDPALWDFEEGVNIQLNSFPAGSDSYHAFCKAAGTLTEQDTVIVRACEMTFCDPNNDNARSIRRNLLTAAKRWKKRWDNRLHVTLEIPQGVSLQALAQALATLNVPIPQDIRVALRTAHKRAA